MIGLQTITKENQQFMNIFISLCLLIPFIVFLFNVGIIIRLNLLTSKSKYNMTEKDMERVQKGLIPRLPEPLRVEMERELIQQSHVRLNTMEHERSIPSSVNMDALKIIQDESHLNEDEDIDEQKEKEIPGLIPIMASQRLDNAKFMDTTSNAVRADSLFDRLEDRVSSNDEHDSDNDP